MAPVGGCRHWARGFGIFWSYTAPLLSASPGTVSFSFFVAGNHVADFFAEEAFSHLQQETEQSGSETVQL